MSKGGRDGMRRPVALLLILLGIGAVVMFAGIGGSASRVTSAQAGRLGIDDEMTDEQERKVLGWLSESPTAHGFFRVRKSASQSAPVGLARQASIGRGTAISRPPIRLSRSFHCAAVGQPG